METVRPVLLGELRKVYLLVGHDQLNSHSQPASGLEGLRRLLRSKGFDAQPLRLSEHSKIPEDAAALFSIGAQQDLSTLEVDMVADFAEEGGQVVAALDPSLDGSKATWLNSFGFRLGPRLVLSKDASDQRSFGLPVSGPEKSGSVQLLDPNGTVVFEGLRVIEGENLEPLLYYRLPPSYVSAGNKERLPVAAARFLGSSGGRLVVLGGSSVFQNRSLPLFSNTGFVKNLLQWTVRSPKSSGGFESEAGVQLLSSSSVERLILLLVLLVELLLLGGLFTWGSRNAWSYS